MAGFLANFGSLDQKLNEMENKSHKNVIVLRQIEFILGHPTAYKKLHEPPLPPPIILISKVFRKQINKYRKMADFLAIRGIFRAKIV